MTQGRLGSSRLGAIALSVLGVSVSFAPPSLRAEDKVQVWIAACPAESLAAFHLGEAVRQKIAGQGFDVTGPERWPCPQANPWKDLRTRQRAKQRGASIALMVAIREEANPGKAEAWLADTSTHDILLGTRYDERVPAQLPDAIARDVLPFLRGVTSEKLPDILASLASGDTARYAQGRAELRALRGEALALALLDAFSEAESDGVRTALAEKLADLGDTAALSDLVRAFEGTARTEGDAVTESGLRCRLGISVCRLAGKARDAKVAPLIARLIQEEQVRVTALRKTADSALRRLGPDMVTLTADERARAKEQADYYSQLAAESTEFQEAGIDALGRIADAGTAPVLLATLRNDEHAERARQALVAMGPAASAALLDALHDEWRSPDAARLLGEIRDPNTVDPLLREMPGAVPFIRSLIIEALGRIGGTAPTAAIRPCLEDPYLAPAAARALGRLSDVASVPRLSGLLRSASLRDAAAEALCRIGTENALHAVLPLLASSSTVTDRNHLIRLLGLSRNPDVLRVILPLVREREHRDAVAQAISRMGPLAEPGLLDALGSPDWSVRRDATYLLGFAGSAHAADRLKAIASGTDAEMSFMARSALSQIEERLERTVQPE